MKTKAYLLAFDGLADWEPALALCEINKKKHLDVVTVGFSRETIVTMGGLKIAPDQTIKDVNIDEACIFIAPGGDMWEQETNDEITVLLQQLHAAQAPIAAICGATLAIARAGLLKHTLHTSNSLEYLKAMVADYECEEYYVDKLAVADKNIITASGVGSVEFAYEIIKQLRLYDEQDAELWFNLFKHGVWAQAVEAQSNTGAN